jgi:hypothetical protein
VKNYLSQVTGTVGNGKKLITATGNSRPGAADRDWQLCGDEYGEMKVGNMLLIQIVFIVDILAQNI